MNNPDGVNGFDQFAAEPAYGQIKQDNALQAAAPLASGGLASGPITAPKPSKQTAQPSQAPAGLPAEPQTVAPPNPTAQLWAAIAATPGSSPLVQEYARMAAQVPVTQ